VRACASAARTRSFRGLDVERHKVPLGSDAGLLCYVAKRLANRFGLANLAGLLGRGGLALLKHLANCAQFGAALVPALALALIGIDTLRNTGRTREDRRNNRRIAQQAKLRESLEIHRVEFARLRNELLARHQRRSANRCTLQDGAK